MAVVEPCLCSVKVLAFIVEAFMASENVALTLVARGTPVAPACGATLCTDGGVVSAPGLTSMKPQVAGNSGPGPADVEIMPTANPVVPPNQPAGIDVGVPMSLRILLTPLVLTT